MDARTRRRTARWRLSALRGWHVLTRAVPMSAAGSWTMRAISVSQGRLMEETVFVESAEKVATRRPVSILRPSVPAFAPESGARAPAERVGDPPR